MNTIRFSLLVFLSCWAVGRAQPYVEGGETRHRFAQTSIGVGVQYIPGQGTAVWDNNEETQVQLSSLFAPVLSIGGLHFWGHADFSIRIPIATIAAEADKPSGVSLGIGTGVKVFPWRLEHSSIRPYLGFEWSLLSYQSNRHETEGPTLYLHRLEPEVGLVYSTSVGSFDAGVRFIPTATVDYPVDATNVKQVSLPTTIFTIGYSFPFETTLSAETFATSGQEHKVEKQLAAQGHLDGFTASAGLSSAFTLTRTNAIDNAPALDLPVPPAVFPEVTVGYYKHDLDAALNLLYRSIEQKQVGYGMQQQWQRKSIALEGIKFISDYNGFVPFIGVMLSREYAFYNEATSTSTAHQHKHGWTVGVVFGWDIRPNRLQWFTIRTAVRYTPVFDIVLADTAKASFNHLEVNFFQLVVHPARLF